MHTPKGPRARSLANFAVLTDAVVATARARASRPFNAQTVRTAAARAGAQVDVPVPETPRPPAMRHFVESSRRMAATLERPPSGPRRDPGESLIELMGFADEIARVRASRELEPLTFPPLALLAEGTAERRPERPPNAAPRPSADDQRASATPQFPQLGGLAGRIVSLHELLDSLGVPHQFGGAIALAWYRNPRATTDIDVNLTVPPAAAAPVLGSLTHLGVEVTGADRDTIARDGQARLVWNGSYLDVFFATLELHLEMEQQARLVWFGPVQIPILSPEHLVVCKAVFDRPKDWLDIEEMIRWGTWIEPEVTLHWVGTILGTGSQPYGRLVQLLADQAAELAGRTRRPTRRPTSRRSPPEQPNWDGANPPPSIEEMPEKISMGADGALNVPEEPIIPFIEGDGTGVDIWPVAKLVLDAAAAKHGNKVAWKEVLGQKAFDETGNWLPDETVESSGST